MARIGSAKGLALLAVLWAGAALAQDVDFYQTVDRNEVGTEDTLRLTVVIVNAKSDAKLTLPEFTDFEVLSKTPVDSTSIQINGGGTQIQRVRKWVMVLRPTRAGTLKIGESKLQTDGKSLTADSIQITVKKGTVADPGAQAQRDRLRDPFRDFFGPGFEDPFGRMPEPEIPRSDSDLFIRTYVTEKEVYIGEQVSMSVYVFSRVDLSSVDSVTFPKLEGFWSEDIDSPTQLSGEPRIINGVPYRAYLLKRKALFPLKAGTLEIDPVQADITTGYLFAGHKVHRKGNKVTLKVKPLPQGAPKGFSTTNVGRWQLQMAATPHEVKLGEPVTVKVTLEGRGNVKNITLPRLNAPKSFKIYDPTTTDKVSTRNGIFGGRRTQEYLVVPQQTGEFTLESIEFPYFNPKSEQYEVARTEPISVRVVPGAGGAGAVAAGQGALPEPDGPKNVLTADTLQPPRHAANFSTPGEPLWRKGWFIPAVVSPLGLWAALGVLGFVRARAGREDEGAARKKKARAARKRLQAAEKLRKSGSSAAFYAEVEKALIHFLDAKLGEPVTGLTRDALAVKLAEKGAKPEARQRILSVLESCEYGRFAPGGAETSARDRLLDDAEAAMEALESR